MLGKKLYQVAVLIFVSCPIFISCYPQHSNTGSPGNAGFLDLTIDKTTEDLMQKYRVPGVAIAVVNSQGTLISKYYGYTDKVGSAPISEATVFEGASLGKPLFAYLVLNSNQYDLHTPIANYLNRTFIDNNYGALVTMGHLLSHSSGLMYSEPLDRRYFAAKPGTKWQYSGLGYLVLQQTLESTSRNTLDDMMHETINTKLGMKHTFFFSDDTKYRELAKGHDRDGRSIKENLWPSANVASSLRTTADDYGKFLSAMLFNLMPETNDGIAKKMIAPQIEVDTSLDLYWSLGWAVTHNLDETMFLHWGSNPGYKSLAIASVEQNLGMVVLTNGDNGLELATELVPVVFNRTYPFLQFYMLHPDD